MGNKTKVETQIKKKKSKAKLRNSEEKKGTDVQKLEETRSKKLNKHKMFDETTSSSKKKKYKTVHHEYEEENFTAFQKIDREQANKAKNDVVVTNEILNDNLEIDERPYTQKKKSKTKLQEHKEENSTSIRKLDKKQRKKAKDNIIAEEELSNNNLETTSEKPKVKKKKDKLKTFEGESNVNETKDFRNNIGKKTIFIDGEPLEVPITIEATNHSVKSKSKKFLNDDEAEVNDEDIDKFCDELDDEDNKQYEEWVKLIEASMHSNKKSK